MFNNPFGWGGNPWGQQQEVEEAQEKKTKVIELESLARQNNLILVIQNAHDGWLLRWGQPEQYLPVTNRAKLHEAIDRFAGTPPDKREVRASVEAEPIQAYQRGERDYADEWEEFAGELAAGLQSCLHGMSAGHPALPIVNLLLAKAARKGLT